MNDEMLTRNILCTEISFYKLLKLIEIEKPSD